MKNSPIGNNLSFKGAGIITLSSNSVGAQTGIKTENNDSFTKTEVKPQYNPSTIALYTAAGLGAVFSAYAAFKKGAGKLVKGGAIATGAAALGAILYNHFNDKVVKKTQTFADKSVDEYYEHYKFGKLFKAEGTHRGVDHKDEKYEAKYDKKYVKYFDKAGSLTREESLLNFEDESVAKEIADYVYENGRLAKKLVNSSDKDFDNQIITYKYDTQGRIAEEEITSQQDGKVIDTVKYTYGANGHVTQKESVKEGYARITTVTEYTDDAKNLITKVTTTKDEYGDNWDNTTVEEYSYYDDGAYKEIKSSTKGKDSTEDKIKSYNPDGSYIEKTVTKQEGTVNTKQAHCNKKGNLILSEDTKQDSEGKVLETARMSFSYDNEGRNTKMETTTVDSKQKQTSSVTNYFYGKDGKLSKKEDEQTASKGMTKVTELYDKKGRVIEVIKDVTAPDGRTSETEKGEYTYDTDGKKTGQCVLTKDDGKKYEYKEIYGADGAMLEEQGTTTFADGGTNNYTIKFHQDRSKTETGTSKFKDGRTKEYTEVKDWLDRILSENNKILYPEGKTEAFDAKYEYDSKNKVVREEKVTKDKDGKEEKTVKENTYTFNDKEDVTRLETTTTKQDGTVEKEITQSDYTYKKDKDKWGDTRFKIDTEKRKVTHADGKVDEYDIKYEYPNEEQRIEKGVMKCPDGKVHTYETEAEGWRNSYDDTHEKGTTVFSDGGKNEYTIDFDWSQTKTEKGRSTFVNGDIKDYTEEYDINGRKIKEEYTIKHKDGSSETKKKVFEQGEWKEVPVTP